MERIVIAAVVLLALAPTAKPTVPSPPDHSIEQRIAEQVAVTPVVHAKDAYTVAWEEAQKTGKLCIYIGAKWCPHCPKAQAAFRENAVASGGACVELDADNPADKPYIDKIVREHGKGRGIPQTVVYQKFGDEWQIKTVIGNRPSDIKAAMTNLQAAESVVKCSCKNCTRSCRFGGNCACR